jgi:hypothetical protein
LQKAQLQNALALIVEGLQVNLGYDPDKSVEIINYVHQCIQTNALCVLRTAQGAIHGIFRGEKISGVFFTQIDATLQTLQIENLNLQNVQLKSNVDDEFWKHGKKFD